MSEPTFGPLRLYDGYLSFAACGPAAPESVAPPSTETSLVALARKLAARETLRPTHNPRWESEPLTLPWFLSLEQARHNRQGRWLPKLLEFGKHQGEKLLGLGSGLGSDLVRYAAAGAEVIAASGSLDELSLARRNFELRGLGATFLHANPCALPVESASIDVVCLTGLLHEMDDPAQLVDEVYRVLKPGGKLLAVVPAHYDIDYWSRCCLLAPRQHEPDLLGQRGRPFKSRALRQLLGRFLECRVWKRHLRRADVPHLWRWVPLSLLERLVGRLLVFKGFKPVSAARVEQVAA
jgi:SAM-dependent methyltransferase